MSTIATCRLVHRHVAQQVLGVVGLGRDLEAGVGEKADDALAKQDRVLGDHDLHRVAQHGDGVPERREVARQTVGEELVDVLRLRQPGQPMAAEVANGEGRGRRRGSREQDLPAMPGGADPRRPMDVDPRVALVGDECLADVDPHAHPDVAVAGPRLLDQGVLTLDGGRDGLVERGERSEDLVAMRVDDDPSCSRRRPGGCAGHS